jgi:A/G-specific adenine glycosylase
MGFAQKLITWQRRHGRHDLPWQGTRDPYRIWLSEVMLQQTQVAAVIPYYERFLARFPDVHSLARASEDDVLTLWSGLGYYARGRNLRKAAIEISTRGFPRAAQAIAELPGIGRSTAAAIAAFAFGERAAILDGNVKRVIARCFAVEGEERLWALAERLLPGRGIETYTQALMDLGATVCTRRNPACARCPIAALCTARKKSQQHVFPAPRPRKALPLKKATWWVLVKDGKVLMDKRPGAGLWGGLLTFPEAAQASWKIQSRKQLPVIEHGFTHFRLRATPLLCRVNHLRLMSQQQWVSLDTALESATPTPVKKLLRQLRDDRGLSPTSGVWRSARA